MSTSFFREFLLISSLLFCLFLGSCDRYQYPFARAKEPKDNAQYTVQADINKSPAKP